MVEGLSELDPSKILVFVAPGAIFAILRSFAIRGFFPKLSKDDLGALAISSAVYALVLKLFRIEAMSSVAGGERSPYFLFFVLLVAPAIFGMASGLIEAGDHVGRSFCKYGLRLPSPEINAWETMFREMPAGSILMVCLADDTWVYGRWVAGSASSQSTDSRDLYLSEVGALSDATYSSYVPQRGVYFSAGEVKRIEVVGNPLPAAIDGA